MAKKIVRAAEVGFGTVSFTVLGELMRAELGKPIWELVSVKR